MDNIQTLQRSFLLCSLDLGSRVTDTSTTLSASTKSVSFQNRISFTGSTNNIDHSGFKYFFFCRAIHSFLTQQHKTTALCLTDVWKPAPLPHTPIHHTLISMSACWQYLMHFQVSSQCLAVIFLPCLHSIKDNAVKYFIV